MKNLIREGHVIFVIVEENFVDHWILDSRCCFHVWFDTYKECDPNIPLISNDSSSKTIGIDTIKVKMFYDVVKILNNVKHVPKLRMSLISLGAHLELWFLFFFKEHYNKY